MDVPSDAPGSSREVLARLNSCSARYSREPMRRGLTSYEELPRIWRRRPRSWRPQKRKAKPCCAPGPTACSIPKCCWRPSETPMDG